MDLQLKDKVTLITGPAKGMGAAITLAFAREGAKLVLAGRDTAAIEPVAAEARALGAEAIVVPCDLTKSEQTEALAAAALKAFGRIDVLVNVAGGSGPIGKTGWETTTDEFNEIVELNMTGCFNTIHAVLPSMIERRSGKVVNLLDEGGIDDLDPGNLERVHNELAGAIRDTAANLIIARTVPGGSDVAVTVVGLSATGEGEARALGSEIADDDEDRVDLWLEIPREAAVSARPTESVLPD